VGALSWGKFQYRDECFGCAVDFASGYSGDREGARALYLAVLASNPNAKGDIRKDFDKLRTRHFDDPLMKEIGERLAS